MKKTIKKSLTDGVRRLDVLVLAIYALGGHKRSIDTEDAAVKAHELAPGMFSWQKYPQQINLELVRVSLSDAKKPKYGSLVIGTGREGWRLSAEGLAWATSQGKHLLGKEIPWDADNRKAGSIDAVRKRREKARLLASPAWTCWKAGLPLSVRDAREIFRIDGYTIGKMLEIKIVRLQSLFKGESEVERFLKEAGTLVMETGEGS